MNKRRKIAFILTIKTRVAKMQLRRKIGKINTIVVAVEIGEISRKVVLTTNEKRDRITTAFYKTFRKTPKNIYYVRALHELAGV